MNRIIQGIVHGRTIELDQEVGVPDGQRVEVALQVIPSAPSKTAWGDGLRRCAGALANEWTAEDDRILEAIHEDRKRDTRQEIAE